MVRRECRWKRSEFARPSRATKRGGRLASVMMDFQIPRNKIKIFRNEIQAGWNKFQIGRNEIQIQILEFPSPNRALSKGYAAPLFCNSQAGRHREEAVGRRGDPEERRAPCVLLDRHAASRLAMTGRSFPLDPIRTAPTLGVTFFGPLPALETLGQRRRCSFSLSRLSLFCLRFGVLRFSSASEGLAPFYDRGWRLWRRLRHFRPTWRAAEPHEREKGTPASTEHPRVMSPGPRTRG